MRNETCDDSPNRGMKKATPTPSQARPLHALVVDDDEGMRRTVVVLLRSRNIRSTTAANGAEAIERLSSGRVDFVLTDLHMPRVNGFELLQWLRANQPGVPAVLMTGVLTVAAARAALEGGAVAVLSKPFGPVELSAVLDELFSSSEVSPLPVLS